MNLKSVLLLSAFLISSTHVNAETTDVETTDAKPTDPPWAYTGLSDQNLKSDIQHLRVNPEWLDNLHLYTFTWKDWGMTTNGTESHAKPTF